MKKLFKLLFIFVFIFALVSCSGNDVGDGYTSYGSHSSAENDVVDTSTSLKITYTVEYTIYTDFDDDNKKSIKDKVTEFAGATIASYESEEYARFEYKVPTNKLNEFLDYVDTFNGVGSKSVSSEDITSSYNYTAAQIQTLTTSIASLNTLLASASTTADVIAIQTKLDEYNAKLLALNNTLAAYNDELDYSRVTIKYYPSSEETKGFFEEYLGNLLTVFVFIGTAILYIVPIGGVLFGLSYGSVKLVKVVKKKKNKGV